jgi:hypothetical protein
MAAIVAAFSQAVHAHGRVLTPPARASSRVRGPPWRFLEEGQPLETALLPVATNR